MGCFSLSFAIGGLVEKILLELTGNNADFTGFPITSEF